MYSLFLVNYLSNFRENEFGNVYVENVTTIPVMDMEEVFEYMAQVQMSYFPIS